MYKALFIILIFALACKDPAKKFESQTEKKDTAIVQSNDVDINNASSGAADADDNVPLPTVKRPKSPNGIYQTKLPLDNRIEQTIAFNNDFTYHLQEKYLNEEKDSVITTKGTWTPSDGFIWLYKDQIAVGRYKWKGDTLQYYSPALKKSFSMKPLQDATKNKAWRNKSKEGAIVFATGTEPFWNFQIDKNDSLSFLLAEWKKPFRAKVDSSFTNSDSTGYFAEADSAKIRVTIFPYFCSDGMSDLIYRNKVKVHYNQQVYTGCGIFYNQGAH